MNPRTSLTSMALAASLAFATVTGALATHADDAQAQGRRVDFRDRRRQMRLELARVQGLLSTDEYALLAREQYRIDVVQAQAAHDGIITTREAREIERLQEAQSRRIERLRNASRGARRVVTP